MTKTDQFVIAVYEMLLSEEKYTEVQALCITSKVRVLHTRYFQEETASNRQIADPDPLPQSRDG